MSVKYTSVGILLSLLGNASAWWQPESGTTWQIVLSQPLKNTSMDVEAYDFDLFDNPASTITSLHQAGRKAICYFSAGSWEKWRDDAGDFDKADLGKPLDGWPGERWLNTNSANVRKIMQKRMDTAVAKGCDAIDPDNIDVYDNGGGGFGLKKPDAADYVQFLASEGHKRGLAVGLKNGGALISTVLNSVDFQVNEQCAQYNECKTFQPFVKAGKPVFHIEYVKGTPTKAQINKICANKDSTGFSTLIKHLKLEDWAVTCPAASTRSQQSGNSQTSPALRSRKSSEPEDNGASDASQSVPMLVLLTAAVFAGLLSVY